MRYTSHGSKSGIKKRNRFIPSRPHNIYPDDKYTRVQFTGITIEIIRSPYTFWICTRGIVRKRASFSVPFAIEQPRKTSMRIK